MLNPLWLVRAVTSFDFESLGENSISATNDMIEDYTTKNMVESPYTNKFGQFIRNS